MDIKPVSAKISIITVCYNASKTIEDTILSVINQKYDNIEYIIIDGGSTDQTLDIIKKYTNELSYWISEPDKGIYDAMNKGIAHGSGEFFYFLGADDLLCEDVIRTIPWNKYKTKDIIYGNIKYKTSGKIIVGKTSNWQLTYRNIPHQAIFYGRKIFKKLHYRYDIQYKSYADYVLNLKCWHNKEIAFHYIDTTIAIYNEAGFSSNGIDPQFNQDVLTLFRKYIKWYMFPLIAIRKFIGKIKRRNE